MLRSATFDGFAHGIEQRFTARENDAAGSLAAAAAGQQVGLVEAYSQRPPYNLQAPYNSVRKLHSSGNSTTSSILRR